MTVVPNRKKLMCFYKKYSGPKHSKGFTMIEVMVASMIMVLIFGGTAAMMVSTMHCYQSEVAQTDTDTDAVMAMQLIVKDVREARSVTITTNGTHLIVTPPLRMTDGYYDRTQSDSNNQVDYYLSNSTGSTTQTGMCLWRKTVNNYPVLIKKNVSSLTFEYGDDDEIATHHSSIKITINTLATINRGSRSTQLTQRVVYLRNYSY